MFVYKEYVCLQGICLSAENIFVYREYVSLQRIFLFAGNIFVLQGVFEYIFVLQEVFEYIFVCTNCIIRLNSKSIMLSLITVLNE